MGVNKSNMRRLFFILAVFLLCVPHFNVSANTNGNLPRQVTDALKSGSAEDMEDYLLPTLEVSINGTNSIYSKQQAIQVLSSFFSENKPVAMEEKHHGGKGVNKFSVIVFNSAEQQYRATVRYNIDADKTQVEQISIEDDLGL